MRAVPVAQRMTADEFLAQPLGEGPRWRELVDGEVIVNEPTARHNVVQGRCSGRSGTGSTPARAGVRRSSRSTCGSMTGTSSHPMSRGTRLPTRWTSTRSRPIRCRTSGSRCACARHGATTSGPRRPPTNATGSASCGSSTSRPRRSSPFAARRSRRLRPGAGARPRRHTRLTHAPRARDRARRGLRDRLRRWRAGVRMAAVAARSARLGLRALCRGGHRLDARRSSR